MGKDTGLHSLVLSICRSHQQARPRRETDELSARYSHIAAQHVTQLRRQQTFSVAGCPDAEQPSLMSRSAMNSKRHSSEARGFGLRAVRAFDRCSPLRRPPSAWLWCIGRLRHCHPAPRTGRSTTRASPTLEVAPSMPVHVTERGWRRCLWDTIVPDDAARVRSLPSTLTPSTRCLSAPSASRCLACAPRAGRATRAAARALWLSVRTSQGRENWLKFERHHGIFVDRLRYERTGNSRTEIGLDGAREIGHRIDPDDARSSTTVPSPFSRRTSRRTRPQS